MLAQMSPPDLPLDVLVTVAEFLAGNHAIGTLAALNQVSREVQRGTLRFYTRRFSSTKGPGLCKLLRKDCITQSQ